MTLAPLANRRRHRRVVLSRRISGRRDERGEFQPTAFTLADPGAVIADPGGYSNNRSSSSLSFAVRAAGVVSSEPRSSSVRMACTAWPTLNSADARSASSSGADSAGRGSGSARSAANARADSPCASAISASVRASIMRSASSRTRPRALSSKRSASSNSPATPYSRAASKANRSIPPEEAAMCESLVLRGSFEVPPGAHQCFGTRHARRVLRIGRGGREPKQDAEQRGRPAPRASLLAAKRKRAACGIPLETRLNGSVADSTGRARAGTLFLVATPIGNLQDLSARASRMPARSATCCWRKTRDTRGTCSRPAALRAPPARLNRCTSTTSMNARRRSSTGCCAATMSRSSAMRARH